MSKTLTLFGNIYEVTDSRERYNTYRNEFRKIAVEAATEFEMYYNEHLEELDKIVELADNHGKLIIHNATLLIVRRLISKGIYETDTFALIENAVEKPVYFQEAMDFVRERIAKIEDALKRAEAARQAQIDSASSSWSGGGYGIEGALKGAAQAAVLNVASGAITSAITSGEAKRQLSARDQKLYNLLNNTNTIKQLSDGIYKDIFCLLKTFVDILEKTETENVSNIPEEDIRKSRSIYQNLKDNLYDDPQLKANMWVKMLQYYPYDVRYFSLLLSQGNDDFSNVMEAAKWYNIPMDEAAASLLSERYQFKVLTAIEDVETQKAALLEDMQKYHISETPLLALADSRMEEIRLEMRTYKGVIYDTKESRCIAEELDNRLLERINTVNRSSLSDMMVLYQDILSQSDYPAIRKANAASLSGDIVVLIQKSDMISREQLEIYSGTLSADSDKELHKPILKAINSKLKKMNFNDKKAQVASNLSSGVKNISGGIGGLFKKKKTEDNGEENNNI